MSIQVVKQGTRIKTVIGDVKALVTGICIRDDVDYEIAYFNNGERKSAWVKRYEFVIDVQEKKQAGFVSYDIADDESNHTQLLLN